MPGTPTRSENSPRNQRTRPCPPGRPRSPPSPGPPHSGGVRDANMVESSEYDLVCKSPLVGSDRAESGRDQNPTISCANNVAENACLPAVLSFQLLLSCIDAMQHGNAAMLSEPQAPDSGHICVDCPIHFLHVCHHLSPLSHEIAIDCSHKCA